MTSKPYPKYTLTNWDALIMVVILLIGALVYHRYDTLSDETASLTAVISDHGEEVARIALSDVEDAEVIYVGQTYHLTVALTPDGVSVAESDCPSQDCVHTGTITKAGQSIVCLPAQVVVYLEGDGAASPADVIVG